MQGKRPIENGDTSHYAENLKLQTQGSTLERRHTRSSMVHNWYREYFFLFPRSSVRPRARACVVTEGTEIRCWN